MNTPKNEGKAYAALTKSNLRFLLAAGLPFALPEKDPIRYVEFRGAYVPEGFNPRETAHALWLKAFLDMQAQTGPPRRNGPGAPMLLEWLAKNYVFLPLDVESLHFVRNARLRYEEPLTDLARPAFFEALDASRAAVRRWIGAVDPKACGWSANWLFFDAAFLESLSIIAHTAQALVPFLRERAREVLVIRRAEPGVLPNFVSNDLVQTFWEAALPDIVRPLLTPEAQLVQLVSPDTDKQDFSVLRDSVFFALPGPNVKRHSPLLVAGQKAGLPLALGVLENIYADNSIEKDILQGKQPVPDIPAVVLPATPGSAAGPAAALLQKTAEGIFPQAKDLGYMFRQLAEVRFHNIEQTFQALCGLFKQHPPAVVVAEDMALGEYGLPLAAAKACGIPSISLPHSPLYAPIVWGTLPATLMACASNYQADRLKPLAYAEDTPVRAFAELDQSQSYHFKFLPPSPRGTGRCNALMLPVPFLPAMALKNMLHPALSRAWLRAVAACARQLQARLDLRVKEHPLSLESFELLDAGLTPEQILPKETSLYSLLPETDILICCDYVSSPNVMALERGVPVITCMLPEDYLLPLYRELVEAGMLVTEPEALLPAVERLLDPACRAEVAARQRAFAAERLTPPAGEWAAAVRSVMKQPHHTHR